MSRELVRAWREKAAAINEVLKRPSAEDPLIQSYALGLLQCARELELELSNLRKRHRKEE